MIPLVINIIYEFQQEYVNKYLIFIYYQPAQQPFPREFVENAFFCSRSNFRAMTQLETLATQANLLWQVGGVCLSIDFLCCFLQVLSVTPIVNVTPMRNSAAKNKLISAASPVSVWPSQRRVQFVEMQFKVCLICSGEVSKTCPISAKRGWFARPLGKNFLWRLIMCLFNLAALIFFFFDRDPTIRQRRRQRSRPTRKQIFQTNSWQLFQITQLLESQDIGREVNTSEP